MAHDEKTLGRPSKLTTEMIDRLCAHLVNGQSRTTAATLSGIGPSTLWNWLSQGRQEPETLAGDLLVAVERAEAEFLARHVANVERAAIEDCQWTASAWLLERRDPESWARKSRVQVDHAIAAPPVDPAIGSTSMMMQTVVLQLANNPDVSTWPEPMRLAYESMTGQPAPTIDGDAAEPEPQPAQAETAAAEDLF